MPCTLHAQAIIPFSTRTTDPGSVLPHPTGAGRQPGPRMNLIPVKSRPLKIGLKPGSPIIIDFIGSGALVRSFGPGGYPVGRGVYATTSTLIRRVAVLAAFWGICAGLGTRRSPVR